MRRKCNDLEVGTGGVQEERTWMAWKFFLTGLIVTTLLSLFYCINLCYDFWYIYLNVVLTKLWIMFCWPSTGRRLCPLESPMRR
jgi:hypothetical protein